MQCTLEQKQLMETKQQIKFPQSYRNLQYHLKIQIPKLTKHVA